MKNNHYIWNAVPKVTYSFQNYDKVKHALTEASVKGFMGGQESTMRKATKILILLLLLDALLVFGLQLIRWRGAWVFVALYWAILTVKNYLDWKGRGK